MLSDITYPYMSRERNDTSSVRLSSRLIPNQKCVILADFAIFIYLYIYIYNIYMLSDITHPYVSRERNDTSSVRLSSGVNIEDVDGRG